MRVSTDEESTWESIVFKNDLMNDTRTWLPETDVVFCASSRQEIVNLFVNILSTAQILSTSKLGLDQMITVDSGWSLDLIHSGAHELQNGHLSSRILASYSIGSQLQVRLSTFDFLGLWFVKMRIDDLLGKCEWLVVQPPSDNAEVLAHLLVVNVASLFPVILVDLLVQRGVCDGSQASKPLSGFEAGIHLACPGKGPHC